MAATDRPRRVTAGRATGLAQPSGGDPSADNPSGNDPSSSDPSGGDPSSRDPSGADPVTGGASDALTYEQARDELGDLVRQLESGGTGLEESLRLWERGEYLVGVCQQWLDGARARLEQAAPDRP